MNINKTENESITSKSEQQVLDEMMSLTDSIVFLTGKELEEPKSRSSPVVCLMNACKALTNSVVCDHAIFSKFPKETKRVANRVDNSLLMVEINQKDGTPWLADIHKLYKVIKEDIHLMDLKLNNDIESIF